MPVNSVEGETVSDEVFQRGPRKRIFHGWEKLYKRLGGTVGKHRVLELKKIPSFSLGMSSYRLFLFGVFDRFKILGKIKMHVFFRPRHPSVKIV